RRVGLRPFEQRASLVALTTCQRNQPQPDIGAVAIVAEERPVIQQGDDTAEATLGLVQTPGLQGEEAARNARQHAAQLAGGAGYGAIDGNALVVERLALLHIAEDARRHCQLVIGRAGDRWLIRLRGEVDDRLE